MHAYSHHPDHFSVNLCLCVRELVVVVLCVAHVLVMCEGFAVAVHTEGRSFILRTAVV